MQGSEIAALAGTAPINSPQEIIRHAIAVLKEVVEEVEPISLSKKLFIQHAVGKLNPADRADLRASQGKLAVQGQIRINNRDYGYEYMDLLFGPADAGLFRTVRRLSQSFGITMSGYTVSHMLTLWQQLSAVSEESFGQANRIRLRQLSEFLSSVVDDNTKLQTRLPAFVHDEIESQFSEWKEPEDSGDDQTEQLWRELWSSRQVIDTILVVRGEILKAELVRHIVQALCLPEIAHLRNRVSDIRQRLDHLYNERREKDHSKQSRRRINRSIQFGELDIERLNRKIAECQKEIDSAAKEVRAANGQLYSLWNQVRFTIRPVVQKLLQSNRGANDTTTAQARAPMHTEEVA